MISLQFFLFVVSVRMKVLLLPYGCSRPGSVSYTCNSIFVSRPELQPGPVSLTFLLTVRLTGAPDPWVLTDPLLSAHYLVSSVAGVYRPVAVVPASLVDLPVVRVHKQSTGLICKNSDTRETGSIICTEFSLIRQEGGGRWCPVDQEKAEHDDESHREKNSTIEDMLPHTELPQHLDDVPPDLLQPGTALPAPVSVDHSADMVGLTHGFVASEPNESESSVFRDFLLNFDISKFKRRKF